ncbi:hypothetical protein QE152_g29846 [Popillia japonica]|uniref:Secreted protein n=1 Tax=Popillia japonica TaxID=7064 RepID=A0AAW1JH05_POPJA
MSVVVFLLLLLMSSVLMDIGIIGAQKKNKAKINNRRRQRYGGRSDTEGRDRTPNPAMTVWDAERDSDNKRAEVECAKPFCRINNNEAKIYKYWRRDNIMAEPPVRTPNSDIEREKELERGVRSI